MRSRHKFGLRLLLTTAWLSAAAGTVLWYWLTIRKEPSDRAVEAFDQAQRLAVAGQPLEALQAVDRALVGRPNDVGYLVFRGYRELDLAHPEKGEASFRRALSLQPTNAEARIGLAQALAAEGMNDEARSVLALISAGDLDVSQLHRRGQMYAMLSSYELALQDVTGVLLKAPNDPKLLDEASALALASHNWAEAVSLSGRLTSVSNDPALKRTALERQAIALRTLGRLDEAYVAYEQTAGPDNLEPRAELALQLERFEDAIRLYRALLAQRPAEIEPGRRLAYALHRVGRRREAEALYRALVDRGGADPVTRLRYAWLLNSEGRYAEAWQVLAPLPRPATDPELLDLQARTAAWAGKAEESIPLLRVLIRRRPDDAELWKLLAESYRKENVESARVEALRSYVRLASQDWKSRQELAGLLARAGSIDQAVAEYRELVAAHPRDSEPLRELALLLETTGHLREAIPLYLRAIETESASERMSELWLRLGRLYRWTSQPAAAVPWYQRYVAAVSDSPTRRTAEGELALALLESGEAAGSLAQIQDLARQEPLGRDDLLTGARAATTLGKAALAAAYLQNLSQKRSLDLAERIWLAGELRAAGQADRAGTLFEELLRDEQMGDAAVLEAAADLRADRGDHRGALDLYRRISAPPARTLLKIARAAAVVLDLDLASRTYAEYLSSSPEDIEAHLEAARFFARTNQPGAALPAYEKVLAVRGADGLRLELARAELEAEHFQQAEHWARQALDAAEDASDAVVALAQSLHLQGQSAEARRLLRMHADEAGSSPDALLWLGHAAVATDRQLEGFRAFDRALAAGVQPQGAAWLWRGQAAQKRGDFYRATASYDTALANGADAVDVRVAQSTLHTSTLPRVEAPVLFDGDTNDLRLTQAGAAVTSFLPGDWARLGGTILRGEVRQRDFRSTRTVNSIVIDRLFPVPQLEVQAALGQERYESGRLMTGHVAGRFAFSDTLVGIGVSRESLLSIRDGRDPREFNRIIDLASLGPAFEVRRLEGFLDAVVSGDSQLRTDAGEESYQDGNRRLFSYVHYQMPLKSGLRHWIALRPNAYVESFLTTQPAYFSPQRHVTLGTMLHGIFTFPRWTLEAEVNPHMVRTDGITGFGTHGVIGLTVHWGPVQVGGDAFIFYDGVTPYHHWRAAGRLGVPLAR